MRIRTGIGLAAVIAAALASAAATGVFAPSADARSSAAPTNTAPPTISGTPRQGRTLTTTTGSWSNNPTQFRYQWQRCNLEGTGCTAITGATSSTYTLVAADVDHTIRSVVTASNADGSASATSAPTEVISSNQPPRNTARPTISGTPVVGNELTANPGTWTGGVRSFTYQWQRCDDAGANCAAISGATGRTYGVRLLDVGFTLRVEVTARNDAGTASATSDRTAVVRAASITPPPPPPPPPPASGACSNRINGTPGGDTIRGTVGGDLIRAGLGNDIVTSFNGQDCVYGDYGNDRLFGGNHNDRVYGGAGHDYVDGGSGNDVVSGGNGNDSVIGGLGHDTLVGYLGADRLTGGGGIDRINAGPGNDTIFAKDGVRDFIRCGTGRDTVRGDRFDSYSQCERVTH